MPPPLPSTHRGMTANPLKPVRRYRPGKPIVEEPSSSEEEEEDEDEAEKTKERERRRQAEAQRRQQRLQAPKATSFPARAAGKNITQGVKNVKIEEEDEDEEGFVTEEEDEEKQPPKVIPRVAAGAAPTVGEEESEEEEEEEEEEESEEEESSSEDEAPRRVLLRPTFIRKDKRNNGQTQTTKPAVAVADTAAEAEAHKAQRQEKADMLIRDQLEKDAIARSAANRAWDDDEMVEAGEEGAIDDRDGLDPEAEYAAWKLRELKRIKREREAIEAAEKEREEVERRRNLTAEEREREDREFLAKQKEERDATRGQTGFMQRYFHKGAFFRGDLEHTGLDKRDIMGRRFVDDVARETLPQYMQIRDMTKLGKKGRTRYKDLRTEDTGRFGEGFDHRRSRRDGGPPLGVTDERFLPDRPDEQRGGKGPTGANASSIRERRRHSRDRERSRSRSRSPPRRRSRSRSYSPRRDRYRDSARDNRRDDRKDRHEDRYRDRPRDRYRSDGGSRRKRSPSPYDDREKRRRVDAVS